MTEKRFITIESGIDFGVIDNTTDERIFDIDITAKLNELADENEQLKQQLKSINGLMAFDRPTDQTDKITCVWNKDLIKLDFGGIDD